MTEWEKRKKAFLDTMKLIKKYTNNDIKTYSVYWECEEPMIVKEG